MERNRLGKEKVGDKLGKNKPGRLTRKGLQMTAPAKGMKGSMSRKRTRSTRSY